MRTTWVKLLDQFTLHQNQLRWGLLGICGVAMLCAVAGVVGYFVSPEEAPNPASADVDTLAKYVKSNEFLNTASRERGAYVNQLMVRYKKMNPREQKKAQEQFGNLFRKDRKREKTFWLSYAQNQAQEYSTLSDRQKCLRLDAILTLLKISGNAPRARRNHRDLAPSHRKPDKKKKDRTVREIRKNLPLLLKNTTSDDRVKIARLASDLMSRTKERFSE